MLARQKGGGHHHRHLLAGHDRNEGGAQRNLGLAEADIAAHEAVHGPAPGQIAQHGIDGGELVLGLLVGEAGAELVVKAFRGRKNLAGAQFARRGGADEAFGDLAHPLLEPGLARLPGAAAEPIELHARLLGAVARQKLDILHRQEQPVAAVIGEEQAIVRGVLHLDGLQALEAADTVIHMHHEIAGRERGELGEEIARPPLAARAADEPVAEDVLLGDDGEIGGLEAGLQPQHHHRHHIARQLFDGGKVAGIGERPDMVVAHDGFEAFAGAFGPHRHQHPLATLAQRLDVIVQRLVDIAPRLGALGGKGASLAAAGGNGRDRRFAGHLEGGERQKRPAAMRFLPVVAQEIEPVRRQGLVRGSAKAFLIECRLAGAVIVGDESETGFRPPRRPGGRGSPRPRGDRRTGFPDGRETAPASAPCPDSAGRR